MKHAAALGHQLPLSLMLPCPDFALCTCGGVPGPAGLVKIYRSQYYKKYSFTPFCAVDRTGAGETAALSQSLILAWDRNLRRHKQKHKGGYRPPPPLPPMKQELSQGSWSYLRCQGRRSALWQTDLGRGIKKLLKLEISCDRETISRAPSGRLELPVRPLYLTCDVWCQCQEVLWWNPANAIGSQLLQSQVLH